MLGLAACSTPDAEVGEIGAVKGFLGGAVIEEPHAALLARDALSAGGSAADAAVAAFFGLTVTYPAAVGLGGGGVCLYYDHRQNIAETLDFRLRAPAAGGDIAVPGTLRGMALLHSRYGRLRWAQLIAPAETMARFGHQMSRAMARRLAPAAARLDADALAKRIFLNPDGAARQEAGGLIQVELAALLTRIRSRGIADLYGGESGRQFVAAANSQGGKLTMRDLRGYRATWGKTVQRKVGNNVLHRPVLTGAGGGTAAGEAALVVADRFGSAVACVFGMNGEFGLGRMVPTLGLFLAPSGAGGQRPEPLLAVNHHIEEAHLAVAGSGGAAGNQAAARIAEATLAGGRSLTDAVAAMLASSGDRRPGPGAGLVQAIWCKGGIRSKPEGCRFATDPRGFGLVSGARF
ncbi:MAG: gamma-glutamyltransferase [Alphaproteobacteria bacterium]|nr:gamma-glutamyltransferase [Alphaproteobacteria bacterium]MDP6566772.1 gamma-glutamyltransferase [Alphaproteobacteria bacterium]